MGHLVIDASGKPTGATHMDKIRGKKPNLTDYSSQIMEVSDQPLPKLGAEAPVKVKKEPPAAKQKIKGGY